jgi:hypothetical protein
VTCAGTVYTYAQLEQLWINAGGPSAVAPVAAAIAEAESSGCVTALNPTDNNGKQTSVGLWQVSNGTHSYPSSWLTATGNATEAVAKYRGANNTFTPWGTYDSGAYKTFLSPGTSPDPNVPASDGGGGGGSGGSSDPTCAWSLGTINLIVTSIGGGCIIHKSTLRHLAGGALMVGGSFLALPGLLVLAAFAFRSSGAARAAAQISPVLARTSGSTAGPAAGRARRGAVAGP